MGFVTILTSPWNCGSILHPKPMQNRLADVHSGREEA